MRESRPGMGMRSTPGLFRGYDNPRSAGIPIPARASAQKTVGFLGCPPRR